MGGVSEIKVLFSMLVKIAEFSNTIASSSNFWQGANCRFNISNLSIEIMFSPPAHRVP